MGIEWNRGVLSRCVEVVWLSRKDNRGCSRVAGSARLPGNEGPRSWQDENGRTARHRESARAETRKDLVLSIVVSCGYRDRQRWRTELDLDSCESF
jgi:hypothetical protein